MFTIIGMSLIVCLIWEHLGPYRSSPTNHLSICYNSTSMEAVVFWKYTHFGVRRQNCGWSNDYFHPKQLKTLDNNYRNKGVWLGLGTDTPEVRFRELLCAFL